MALQTIEIPDNKIKVIKEYKSITIPTSTDNIYYSYSGIYNGDFTDWKPITEIQDEPSNYSKYSMVFIANNTGGSITIEYNSYTIEDCYTEDACHNVLLVVDFNPIPISFMIEHNNPWSHHWGHGTSWVSGTGNGIVFSQYHGGDEGWVSGVDTWYTPPEPYNGVHNNWSTNQDNFGGSGGDGVSDSHTSQQISASVRIKPACTVDGAMLEVHMYNGIYDGFIVKYRYAVVDGDDNIYISGFKTKHILTKDIYILDMRLREVDTALNNSDAVYASIEVKVVPDANFAETSFQSIFNVPVPVPAYTSGIDPVFNLIGNSTIILDEGEEYVDEGAMYSDNGFPDAPEVIIYKTNVVNHLDYVTYYYNICSLELTRNIYDGYIRNDGDELIVVQLTYNEVVYTEVEYEIKLKDGIVFSYDDYQILQIDNAGNTLVTYPINTTVLENIELLSEHRRYTVKFFSGGTELLLSEDILLDVSPTSLPYTYSAKLEGRNILTDLVDTSHILVYDVENYDVPFDTFNDTIIINPINGMSIPLNHEHYTTNKQITLKDYNNTILYDETVGGSDNFNIPTINALIRDNTLNNYIIKADFIITNKNGLTYTITDTAFLVYEKYIEPTGSYEVVTDNGSELIVKTSRGSVYTTTGDIYDQLVENIGSKFRMSLDLKNGNSSILQVIENGTLLINENATGSHTFIKDNDVVNIYEKASPLFFFSTEGYVVESINDYPIILLNRGNNQIKLLITILNNISGNTITSIEAKITNLLNNNIVTTNGDIAGKYVNISISDNLETGTLICIECTVTLNNGMNNTTRMVGKVI